MDTGNSNIDRQPVEPEVERQEADDRTALEPEPTENDDDVHPHEDPVQLQLERDGSQIEVPSVENLTDGRNLNGVDEVTPIRRSGRITKPTENEAIQRP